MFRLLPESYYDLSGGVNVLQLLFQFLVTDFFTYGMHRLEHLWPSLYVRSHKAHHKVGEEAIGNWSHCLTFFAVDVTSSVQCVQRVCAGHNQSDSDSAVFDAPRVSQRQQLDVCGFWHAVCCAIHADSLRVCSSVGLAI